MYTVRLIIGIILGFIVGADAIKRDMNGWNWGVFVFFLPIIGIISYLIVSKKHPYTEFWKKQMKMKKESSQENKSLPKMNSRKLLKEAKIKWTWRLALRVTHFHNLQVMKKFC